MAPRVQNTDRLPFSLGGWGRLFEKMTLEHGVENCEAGCRVLKALSQESAFSVGGTPEGPE